MQGIVYKSTGSWYIVKDQQNNFIECKLAGKLRNSESKSTNPVCTGDSVTVKIDNKKTPIIAVSYTHLPSPRDRTRSRMPSSA